MTRYANLKGQDGDRLDSWKEIAVYLGKGVRTAIRWSKNEGMPVYRHAGSKRGAVYAYRSEIDAWIHSDRSVPPRLRRKATLPLIAIAGLLTVAVAAWNLVPGILSGSPVTTAPESPLSPSENTLPEDVTTTSPNALKLYSSGMQDMYRGSWNSAEHYFRQAATEDPGFASAHLFVFWALNNQQKGSEAEALSFLERAMDLSGTASEQERYFIEATYHHAHDRDFDKSCGTYKALVELYPDHYWAAGNALFVCGFDLGNRGDYVRFAIHAAERRPELTVVAASAITFLERDFDRARPYVERLERFIADDGMSNWPTVLRVMSVNFTEFFPAEEYLYKKMLPDVLAELQRIEQALGSMEVSMKLGAVRSLVHFYMALGQYNHAEALGKEYYLNGMLQSWLAFLAGDRVAYHEHLDDFSESLQLRWPDPVERKTAVLRWNIGGAPTGFPMDVMVPLFEGGIPQDKDSLAGVPAHGFTKLRKFEAKSQLIRGRQMLFDEHPGEAAELLWSGVQWFRDNGDWGTFPYYFLGVELLAVASLQRGDVQTAYRDLENAVGQTGLVYSLTVSQYQKVQARFALLARDLGRIPEAEAIEAELAEALALADEDHPILLQIQEHLDERPVIE